MVMCDLNALRLKGDREVVIEAITADAHAFEYASEDLRGDREIVTQAVLQNGYILKYASREMRGDRQIVMQAVSQEGHALEFATEELRGDREIVMAAITENGYALASATEEIRSDSEIMEAVLADETIGQGPLALKVTTLSGRCCTQIFGARADSWEYVLRAIAEELDLDQDQVLQKPWPSTELGLES